MRDNYTPTPHYPYIVCGTQTPDGTRYRVIDGVTGEFLPDTFPTAAEADARAKELKGAQ